ncbi:hypothetical protein PsorP6_014287 [Peronosclerospora sorghi]|uniref:Uncharacterized protein n=1 Tax=Peronosclerospora sorghi TaxID=230839 RepID=A0ACC0VGT3_9STRA|nr:hypothetical protein PsorP6_014287 [Peronosclerospora sorghi]
MVSTRMGLLVIAICSLPTASEVAANMSGKKPETADLHAAEDDRVGRVLEETDVFFKKRNLDGTTGH